MLDLGPVAREDGIESAVESSEFVKIPEAGKGTKDRNYVVVGQEANRLLF